jgi:hypothetical protein
VRSEDGEVMRQTLLDAIAMAEERVEGAEFLSIAIVLNVEDEDGNIRMVTNTYPAKD